jgi:hypothetical protein
MVMDVFLSTFDVGRPVFSVDLAGPLQELDQIVELLLVEIELGHLAATGDVRRLGFIQILMKSPPRRL